MSDPPQTKYPTFHCVDSDYPTDDYDDWERFLDDDISDVSIVAGTMLALGITVAYLPQWYKVIKRRSHYGLSYWMLFLGNINQWFTAINASILRFPQWMACGDVGFLECYPSLISYFQIFNVALFFFPIYVFYLYYYDDSPEHSTPSEKYWSHLLFKVVVALVLSAVLAGLLLVFLDGPCTDATRAYAYALGIISTVANVICWGPQIYMTYKNKMCGSISIVSLAFTAPGALALTFFQIFVTKENWTTWLAFGTAAAQQLTLLFLATYYYLTRERRYAAVPTEEPEDDKGTIQAGEKKRTGSLINPISPVFTSAQ